MFANVSLVVFHAITPPAELFVDSLILPLNLEMSMSADENVTLHRDTKKIYKVYFLS